MDELSEVVEVKGARWGEVSGAQKGTVLRKIRSL